MLDYQDRIVEHPLRFQLIKVEGTEDQYDLVPVPGLITSQGRALNKEFFDSIKEDILNNEVKDGSITTAKIADDAVIGEKIANKTIKNSNLGDEIIRHNNMSDYSVATRAIIDKNVTYNKLADDAVYKIGSYTGNGADHVVDVGFKPRLILIHSGYLSTIGIISERGATAYYDEAEYASEYKVKASTGFSTTYFTNTGFIASNLYELNLEDELYTYIAFR